MLPEEVGSPLHGVCPCPAAFLLSAMPVPVTVTPIPRLFFCPMRLATECIADMNEVRPLSSRSIHNERDMFRDCRQSARSLERGGSRHTLVRACIRHGEVAYSRR